LGSWGVEELGSWGVGESIDISFNPCLQLRITNYEF
jgi:hypothetical protein